MSKVISDKTDGLGIHLEEDLLVEMSNVPSRVHRFGVDVKLNIPQPGRRLYRHAQRIKVYRGTQNFSVDLREDPDQILYREGDIFLNNNDFNTVMNGIKKYRIAFLIFWYSPLMDLDELDLLLKEVDAGRLTDVPSDLREKMSI